jgi:thymidylate kinase
MEKLMIYIIEGKDGIGKTTLINNLKQYFIDNKINNFKFYREPGGTTFSEECRNLLLDTLTKNKSDLTKLLIILASRTDTYSSIRKDIENGFDIIVDRGILSSFIYQYDILKNNKNLRDITFFIQPNINTNVIYLDGTQKNISTRDNNWMDNIKFKHLDGINLFKENIINHQYITFNQLNIYEYNEEKMLKILLNYIK